MNRITQLEKISIGPDKEIELLEFDYKTSSVLELDECIGSYSNDVLFKSADAEDPLGKFWNKLETDCMTACCGIQAFGFWPDNIAEALKELDKKGLLKQFESLRNRVLNSSEQIVGYHRLNQNFAKVSFLQLLDHLIKEVERGLK